MNEIKLGTYGLLAILISALYSWISMLGGRDENYLGIRARIWGRYIAPVTLCVLIIGLSLLSHRFSWWFLTSLPMYVGVSATGYGGDTLWKKLLRRTIWSILRTLAGLSFALFTGSWILLILQAIVGLLTTLILGVINPLVAPQEEGLIKFLSVVFVPFYVL